MRASRCRVPALAVAVLFAAGCSKDGFDLPAKPPPPSPVGFLSGRAVESQAGSDAAKPLESAEASIPGTNIRVITGADGIFTLGPLPPGDFRVLIRHKAAGQLRQVLTDRKTVIRGATTPFGDVFVRQNAEIIGRALVDGRLSGNLGSVAFIAGTPWATLIGDDGSYALRSLPESTVRISAFRDGFQPVESADVFARGGIRTTANDMVLSKPPPGAKLLQGSISGTVFLPGREDASGVKVKVEPMYRKSAMADADGATTDAAGHFTVPGLEPGVYRMRFTSGELPSGELANLLVVSGGSQTLEQPVVLVPEDPSSKTEPPSAFNEDPVDAGTAPGEDAGTTVADAGSSGCRSEADCAFGQICLGGACTSCTRDAECPAGSACRAGKCVRSCQNNDECATGLVCKAGDCVPCAATGECSSPLVCLADTARCGACRTAADCPAGKACFPNGCAACTRDADCGDPTQNLCEAGLCVKGTCRADTDCDPNLSERCVQHQCVGCMQDKDCGAGFLCDATSKKCVAGDCHTSLNCGAGKLCLKNRCSDCTADADCGTGAVCDRGTCFSGSCSTAAECAGSTASPGDRLCTNHLCVDCRTNAECGTGRVCDAGRCFTGDCTTAASCGTGKLCVKNRCTDCTADADCGTGSVCDRGTCFTGNCSIEAQCAGTTASPGDRLCTNHQCVDCRSNADCGTGRVCGAGRCFTGDCTSALNCGAGKLCVNNRCSDCTADADCGTGAVCDRGTCFSGTCSTDAQCAGTAASPGDRLCASHQCVDCRTNLECGTGKVCASGRCYTGDCTAKVDCPTAGSICLNHTCAGCSADTDCGTNELCDPSTNKCVAGNCRINANCVDPTNAARSKICSAQGFCTNCGTSADCGAGQVCTAGYCIAGNCAVDKACTGGLLCVNNSCQSCTADSQCGTGRLCLSGACVAGDCRTDSNCSGGKLCVQNQCTACSSTVACPTGKICASGACVFGNCVTTADCGAAGKPGKLCKQNQCVDCSADAECGTDLCVNGTCTPGNCHNNLDCTTSAGSQFCRSNVCTACDTTTNLCGQGQICDQGRCVAGNCSTRADCDKDPSNVGRLCVNHQCTACAKDADCGNNQVCANGQCKAGNCTSEAQCTGDGKGGTTPCSANQCLACTNNAACNTNGFAGRVCDAGYCYYGSCVTNGDCTSGKVCQNHVCGNCSTNAQCASGQVCAAGSCKPGNCVTEADCPTGPSGGAQLCVNNQCTSCSAGLACTPNSQGSRICDKGYCYSGQCTTESDCGALAGQQGKICKSYQCVTCSTKADCATGEVCDSTGLCKAGNCVTALDCPANASGGRQFCNQNQCTACTGNGFGQCSSGQICDTGYCYAGNCSPTQSCSTGLACINHTCNSCTKNSDCSTGNVCVSGSCKPGNCVTSSDCVPGAGGGLPVCQANYCTPCSGSAPCAAGQICDSGYCFAGNCTPATVNTACSTGQVCASHTCGACSTNADCPSGTQCFPGYGCRGCVADTDCPSPQACVNYACTGNCRSNTDCTVAGQICNSFTKTCGGCSTDTDCGSPSSGKICVNSACIVGDCRVDADCANSGAACKNNKCTLFGPQATLTFTSKDGIASFHPQLLYSPATGRIVFGTSNTFPGGRYLVSYDPATNNYWKAPMGLVTGNAIYPAIAGIFPAKGMAPSGEVVLAWMTEPVAPGGHMVAYDTGTGQPVASAPAPAGKYLYGPNGTNYVCGTEVNGEVRWYGVHNTGTNNDRPSLQGFSIDGRPVFQPTIIGCNASIPTEAPTSIICGNDYLFAVCKNGVEWIDYSTGQIYGKAAYPLNSVYGSMAPPAVVRAAGDSFDTVITYASRTSDSKWVVTGVRPGAASPQLFETPVLPPPFSAVPTPVVDGDGNIYILQANAWAVLDKNGVVRNQAKSSGTPYTGNLGVMTPETAFVDNTTAKTFSGFANVSSTQKFYTYYFDATTWQLTETPGYLPGQPNALSTFAAGPILTTPSGDMWAWGQDTSNNTRLVKLHPQTAATRAAAPAWPQATGVEVTGSRRVGPTGALCSADSDCAGATGCLMGHCRGSCNASNACSGGKLCQNNVCAACLTDGACGLGNVCMQSVCEPGCRADSGCSSGQICWAGKCVTGTCHADSECVAGQACINGACVAGPSIRWTAKTTINANSYRSMWPPVWGSDKTLYLPPVPQLGIADYYVIPASTPPNRSVAFSTPPLGTSDFIYSMPVLFPNLGGSGDMMLFNTKYTTAGSNTAFARVKVAPTLAGTTKLGGNSLPYDTNQDFSAGGAFFKNGSTTVYLAQEKGSTAGALTALDPSNATKLWQVYATPPLSTNCAGPVVGGSGLIYQLCANTTADGFYIRSLDASGAEKGRTGFTSNCVYDGPSLPYEIAIVKPKNVPNEVLLAAYRTGKNGAVCNLIGAFDLVGNNISKRWETPADPNGYFTDNVTADGRYAYSVNTQGVMATIDLVSGVATYFTTYTGFGNWYSNGVLLGADGTAYRVVQQGQNYFVMAFRYGPQGETVIWRYQVPSAYVNLYESLFITWRSGLAFSPEGDLVVEHSSRTNTTGSYDYNMVLEGLTLPTGQTPGLLYNGAWPMYRHDPNGSSNLNGP